jgi:hypothetical protein
MGSLYAVMAWKQFGKSISAGLSKEDRRTTGSSLSSGRRVARQLTGYMRLSKMIA